MTETSYFFDESFDREREFYNRSDIHIKNCRFDGPADGESACKECRSVTVEDCYFNLRYPFWHCSGLRIDRCELTENCRAALWYSRDIQIADSRMHGIKALRECSDAEIINCDIVSPEFGWSVQGLTMKNTSVVAEYFMLRSDRLDFSEVTLNGKYSFQYIENSSFNHCRFRTKDAFWHAKNITVRDSILEGEYLAWYSENLTLENCVIRGTQPFCYCKNLRLLHCRMENTDLCFEKSEVEAELDAPILSIKNPTKGTIRVPSVGEWIMDDDGAKGVVYLTDSLPNGSH